MMYPGYSSGRCCYASWQPGSEYLKDTYLPKMVSGEWLATMALTEAPAGTDLGLMRSKAVARGNGTYALSGAEDLHLGRRA